MDETHIKVGLVMEFILQAILQQPSILSFFVA